MEEGIWVIKSWFINVRHDTIRSSIREAFRDTIEVVKWGKIFGWSSGNVIFYSIEFLIEDTKHKA